LQGGSLKTKTKP